MLFLVVFWGASGSIQGSSRISLEAVGVSRDNFGGILSSSDFPRIPEIMEIDFRVFPVTVLTKLGAIDAESWPGHFPTIGFIREVHAQKNTKFNTLWGLLIGGGGYHRA